EIGFRCEERLGSLARSVVEVEHGHAGLDTEHPSTVGDEVVPGIPIDAARLRRIDVQPQPGSLRRLTDPFDEAVTDLVLLLRRATLPERELARPVAHIDGALLVRN